MDRESDKRASKSSNDPILCVNNCGFFGSAATNNLCSKCYKDYLKTQPNSIPFDKNEAFVEDKVVETSSEKIEIRANKCEICRKRVGLIGFKCKCGHIYCSVHRYSDKHNCVFDYKGLGQEAIAKANSVVKADKIDKI